MEDTKEQNAIEGKDADKMQICKFIKNNETTIDDLDYYALYKICRNITNFRDQISLAVISKNVADIFIESVWSRIKPRLEVGPINEICYIPEYREGYKLFVRSMRTTFRRFCSIDQYYHFPNGLNSYLDLLHSFDIFEFPSVDSCVLKQNGDIEDIHIKKLSTFLPNLTSLVLYRENLSTLNVELFRHLKELYIIDTPVVSTYLIQNINVLQNLHTLDIRGCRDLRLPYLQSATLCTLRLHLHTLIDIWPTLFADVPNLRDFEVRYCKCATSCSTIYEKAVELWNSGDYLTNPNIFTELLKMKAKEITGLKMNNTAMYLDVAWDYGLESLCLNKLQKLITMGWHLNELFLERHIPDKSQLKILGCGDWERINPAKFVEIIRSYNELDIIEVSDYIRFDNYLLQRIASVVETRENAKPLAVWNWTNLHDELTQEQIAYWRQSKVLKLFLRSGSVPKFGELRRDLWGFEMEFNKPVTTTDIFNIQRKNVYNKFHTTS